MKVQPLEFEKPILDLERKLEELRKHAAGQDLDIDSEVKRLQEKIEATRQEVYANISSWQKVQIARHTARPFALDYIDLCFTDFIELHGDRLFGDDKAIPCGLAKIDGMPCVVIGNQKGRDVKENVLRNFGSANPEGYRKALRMMRLAEKFGIPVVSLIDTPGAYPGVGAEERHIAESIAVNLREMMLLRTPIVAVVIGEGGSGGALGIGVADRVYMFENSYYSVISPEGCAAILWKHRKHAPEASEALKLNATDLKEFKIIDDVIPEPMGGAHHDPEEAAKNLKKTIISALQALSKTPIDKLLTERYEKFRKMGVFTVEE
ncbi:MAG: acetyl-CoA carboxylase carboxyltransferase subunit alpha [Chthoniobacterales bacterium]